MAERTNLQIPLSDSLDQLEVIISKIGQGSATSAEDILHRMDEIHSRLNELRQQGITLSAEEAQYEFISNELRKHSKAYLKDMGGNQKLIELRQEHDVKPESWWWFLDEYNAQRIRSSRKRNLFIGGAILIALAVLYGVYQLFLAPSPAVQAELTYENNVQALLANGNWTQALDSANQGLNIVPSDYTLVILKGIAQLKLGQENQANQTFSEAAQMSGSQESFLLTRAISYIRIADYKSALVDAQQVIKMDPNSAEAYFYEGSALQNLGQGVEAYQALNTASELADKQGNVQLVATIRIQMALLLQSINMLQPTQQVTSTP